MAKRIAVIGAGMWGKNHVNTLAGMGELGAVVEMSDPLRAAVEENHPGTPVYSDLSVFLAEAKEKGIVGAVIATPAHTHAAIGVQCMEAGLHVLVEKPMSLTSADSRLLVDQAKERNAVLMVGHLLLFQPAIQFVKEFLDGGKLGQVYTLTQRRSKLGRARAVENVLWSFGVHDVAVLLYLVGTAPDKVQYTGHSAITEGIDDDAHLHLTFGEEGKQGAVVANLHNSWLWPRVERELIVTGEKGILVYDELNQKVIFHDKGIVKEDLANRDEGEQVVFEGAAQPLQLELEHFIECCETGKTPIADGQNGLDVVEVLERC